MPARRDVLTLWLPLLLCVSGSATKFNLFRDRHAPPEGDVRLSGLGSPSQGRVEVYHNGRWGTVCDDGWDMAEARVVCRQLRYPGARSVVIGRNFGEASGPVWLDDVQCNGTESHLFKCQFKNWGVTDCTHKEDVGVICETASTNQTASGFARLLDHSLSLSDDLGQMFDGGRGCDFLISVQGATGSRREDGAPEAVAETICAHKMVLSRFPRFNATGANASITVGVSQSCQPYFSSFVRYLYTRKIDVSASSAQCLHWMASEFGVEQLRQDVGRLFSKVLPEDSLFHTQVSFYTYAKESGDLVLQESCVQFLAWNYPDLVTSPAWARLPVDLLGALLTRSDLVVPDEYFLLTTLESWITEQGDSIDLKAQAALLSHVRFPMIPAERLYDLGPAPESNSSLRGTHRELYRDRVLKAYQFNVVVFNNNVSKPNPGRDDDDYQPRIYTSEPWSHVIDSFSGSLSTSNTRNKYSSSSRYPYGQTSTKSFSTPVHSSLIFKDNRIQWEANVFQTQFECSNRGLRCASVPMTRLTAQSYNTRRGDMHFQNRLLLMCKYKYICHVQDFKGDLAYIAKNGSQLAYPCSDGEYSYRFVVRPQYL